MIKRSSGFLADDKINHQSEIFDYIKELHDYLWRFVRVVNPNASGSLGDFVDDAIDKFGNQMKEFTKYNHLHEYRVEKVATAASGEYCKHCGLLRSTIEKTVNCPNFGLHECKLVGCLYHDKPKEWRERLVDSVEPFIWEIIDGAYTKGFYDGRDAQKIENNNPK